MSNANEGMIYAKLLKQSIDCELTQGIPCVNSLF